MNTKTILAELRAQRDRIDLAVAAIEALHGTLASTPRTAIKAAAQPAPKKRAVSPEARQRMAEAQQKRWAKTRRAVKAVAKKTAAKAPIAKKSIKVAVKKAAPKKGKGGITAAGRKRLSEATKARWAAKKRAAKKAAPVATAVGKEAPNA
jgi:hypothetical protein